MALQSSGKISLSNVNTELGLATNTRRSLGQAATRTLFGVASGRIKLSDGYGKSNRVSIIVTLTSNTTNYTLSPSVIPGYVAGKTDVTLVVNSGVYVYSTNTANAGLTIAALAAGDTVAITNNGYIIGMGGKGGYGSCSTGAVWENGAAGGPALTINRAVSITNNSYIAGGGGGGGGAGWAGGGGGGAGGGDGGAGNAPSYACSNGTPGAGGGPGLVGGNGPGNTCEANPGAGGGRILPGTGGAGGGINLYTAKGGGAGGGGGGWACFYGEGGDGGGGGSANNAGSNGAAGGGGGGGGGWGAIGGTASAYSTGAYGKGTGGAGGKAVNLNGYTVTWITTGIRYGAIA